MTEGHAIASTEPPPWNEISEPSPVESRPRGVVLHARVVCGSGGGPEKTVFNSARYLEDAGYRTICAYMHPPADDGFPSIQRKAADAGARLVSVPDRGPWDLRVARRLLDICRDQRVTIWHGHDYKSNALGVLLSRFWPMRLVTTVHGWVHNTRRTPLYYALDRLSLRFYERVICVSGELQERCRAAGVPPERCLLVENAIELPKYSRRLAAPEARRKLGLEPGRFSIGAVGRLSAEKGFDGLIRAVARLLDNGHDAQLCILGEGDQRPALEKLIAQTGHAARIQLVGYQSQTLAWYEAMDVFALSSLREAFPNVVLEAMAAETPVVATRIAGVPRLVRHDETGLLVNPNDEEGLTNALVRLIEQPALRERLAIAGRKLVEDEFSFDVRMRKICAIYEGLGVSRV